MSDMKERELHITLPDAIERALAHIENMRTNPDCVGLLLLIDDKEMTTVRLGISKKGAHILCQEFLLYSMSTEREKGG
jgi:hypothetical protein